MILGRKRLLAAFLEKDNLKLLSFELAGKSLTRVFAGQITFTPDVLRDAFIADSAKFTSQVKAALAQKEQVVGVNEALLFMPPEKTYIKSLPAGSSVETFIRSLPYFAEELILDPGRNEAAKKNSGQAGQETHIAFEKKLVEDFERPFLESGKKVNNIRSGVEVLVTKYIQNGRYFLVVPFDKEVAVAVCDGGAVLELVSLPKDVFVGRFQEFRLGKGYSDIKQVYTVGVFDKTGLDKIRAEQGLNVVELAPSDIYDLIVQSYVSGIKAPGLRLGISGIFSKIHLPNLTGKLPGQKYLFLVGAAVIGFLLVLILSKGISKVNWPKSEGNKTGVMVNKNQVTPSPTPTATPTVAAKPADYKVRVLNGTEIAGEAGRLAATLKGLGFEVTDTGNATESGFVSTRLRTAVNVPASIIDQIKNSLLTTYKSVTLEPLTDTAVQIEVIIGVKK